MSGIKPNILFLKGYRWSRSVDIDQTPWIPNLKGFLSLLDSGNKDFEFDYEEENDCDAGEAHDDAYKESSNEECKDFFV